MGGASDTLRVGTTLVLCYHRVAEGVEDSFRLGVRPERFRAHLEELCRSGVPSTLDELHAPAERGRFVVTFDDGYADNLWNALPVAASVGVPITIFVTSGALGGKDFWWDRLAWLFRHRPPTGRDALHLDVGDGGGQVALRRGRPGEAETLRRRLLPLGAGEIDRVLDDLASQWGLSPALPEDARPLSPGELRQLAGAECARIGAHTTDHRRLGGRSPAEQFRAIAGSRRELESIVGSDVLHFAYPFGGRDDFDECSVEQVRLAGFKTACTTLPGGATPSTDPYRLPRRLVMDWSRSRFRAQLLRWRLW